MSACSSSPLRLWPLQLCLVGMLLCQWVPKWIDDGPTLLWIVPVYGPALCCFLLMLCWVCCSRASKRERWLSLVAWVVGLGLTVALMHPKMRESPLVMQTIPVGTTLFALAAMAGSRWRPQKRNLVALVLMLLGFSYSLLWRYGGMRGDFEQDYVWRWQTSVEEQLVNRSEGPQTSGPVPESWLQGLAAPEWPEFRGAGRSGIVKSAARYATDWEAQSPELLWQIPVGPGWSSFAVAGQLLFTQEQRGLLESVVCYQAESGAEVWVQSVESRFDEPLGGPGPRATPTLAGEGLYAQGAQGWLMRLDPKTGRVVWQTDMRKVAKRETPMWGFASSPLVVGSLVMVHASGADDLGLLAFDTGTGVLRWSSATGDKSYSSPQLLTIDGESVVAISSNEGVDLFDPNTGKVRLRYAWPFKGYRCAQPQVVDGSSLIIASGLGAGTRRIRLSKAGEGWSAEEEWSSRRLKPDFNDFVIFEGHAYGFDDKIFTCIDLKTGERTWKRGRYQYGKGQVILLRDSKLLVVASERGEAVMLKADPVGHQVLGRFQALKGKTWNHPVVVGDRLYLRNGEQAACYRLPMAE